MARLSFSSSTDSQWSHRRRSDDSFSTSTDVSSVEDLGDQPPLAETILRPNTSQEKAYSHILRITAHPVARSRVGQLRETLLGQVERDGVSMFRVRLQCRFDSTTLLAEGQHMRKKEAREVAATKLRAQLRQANGYHPIDLAEPSSFSAAFTARRLIAIMHHQRLQHLAASVTAEDKVLVMDVEAWDQHQGRGAKILEVGMAVVFARNMWLPDLEDGARYEHYIIEDHLDRWNGRGAQGCPNHKLDYDFGHSTCLPETVVAARLSRLVSYLLRTPGRTFLVGHSIDGDARWLRDAFGLDTTDLKEIDLAEAYMAMEQRPAKRSLTTLCEMHGLAPRNMHNGGNDAVFTYLLAKRMLRDVKGREEMDM